MHPHPCFPRLNQMPIVSKSKWDKFLTHYPDAHLLQTSHWGELKASFGWSVVHVVHANIGAQILFRSLPLGFSFAYIPKGPVGKGWDGLWPEIDALCRARNAVFVKVEPDAWEGGSGLDSWFSARNFVPSTHAVQPPRTYRIDISGDEDHILGRMKQKTRYNIRLAGRKEVVVRKSGDLGTFNRLMEVTSERDEFGVHSPEYYQKAYELFHPRGGCEILIAEYEHQPLAAVMVFARGHRAWYLYGASSNQERNRMPTYLLQWEAIRWARNRGCTLYDMWGIPDHDQETLEDQFTERSDGLWGVYRFKRGFGGEVVRALGPYDQVYIPLLYRFYQWWVNRG